MKVKVRVLAQYWENYSDTEVPYWKSKGGHEFTFEAVNDDLVMYGDLKEALTVIVAAQTNSHNKFEYRDHEVIFQNDDILDSKLLEDEIRKQFA